MILTSILCVHLPFMLMLSWQRVVLLSHSSHFGWHYQLIIYNATEFFTAYFSYRNMNSTNNDRSLIKAKQKMLFVNIYFNYQLDRVKR